jgi:L-arabinose isomerase
MTSGGYDVTTQVKVGVLTMALLEDAYNRTAHMRPAATETARGVARALEQYGTIVHPGLVEDEEQAAAAARQFNAEGVDIIVAVELAYTKGLVPARCFLDTTAPVLVWNTQQIGRLREEDGFDVIVLNSGMAGMPELTAALIRTGREFSIVTSRFDDPQGREKIARVIQAAAVRRRLRTAKVGLVGHPFEGMTDLMFDQLSLRQSVGPAIWPVEPEAIAVRFGEIPQADVDGLVASEKARYRIDMDSDLFERSARLALALESTAREQKLDAFTAFDQVWLTDPRVGIIPSYGTGRLCEIGIPSAPEGDATTAVAQLILQELAGQATTLENYVIDFENNAVVFSHDGHGNPALGTPGAVSVKHSIYYTGVHGYGAGFEFVYEPGVITNLALFTVGGNHWRFVISEGQLLPMEARPISAPQALFRHDTLAVDEWCNAWLRAGAPHHMGAARGRWTPQLLELAKMQGIEAVVV